MLLKREPDTSVVIEVPLEELITGLISRGPVWELSLALDKGQ